MHCTYITSVTTIRRCAQHNRKHASCQDSKALQKADGALFPHFRVCMLTPSCRLLILSANLGCSSASHTRFSSIRPSSRMRVALRWTFSRDLSKLFRGKSNRSLHNVPCDTSTTAKANPASRLLLTSERPSSAVDADTIRTNIQSR